MVWNIDLTPTRPQDADSKFQHQDEDLLFLLNEGNPQPKHFVAATIASWTGLEAVFFVHGLTVKKPSSLQVHRLYIYIYIHYKYVYT